MAKVGKPGFEGQEVLVKIPKDLLAEVDELWPRAQCTSRNEFIRRALWRAVRDARRSAEVPAA